MNRLRLPKDACLFKIDHFPENGLNFNQTNTDPVNRKWVVDRIRWSWKSACGSWAEARPAQVHPSDWGEPRQWSKWRRVIVRCDSLL